MSILMNGAFHACPPLLRYVGTWDVSTVLSYLNGHNLASCDLSLMKLTLRTMMLSALTHPSRSANLAQLDLTRFRSTPEGTVFLPTGLAKQSNPSRKVRVLSLPSPSFGENKKLCPVHSLSLYTQRPKHLRGENAQIFIAMIKHHLPVSSPTIARWLKVINDSGIDSSIFKANSVRSACTSTTSNFVVTTEDIMKSIASSFQHFYCKPVHDATFRRKTLMSATNNTILICETKPSEIQLQNG